MLNLIFQSKTSCPSKTIKASETKASEQQRKCDKSDSSKSMPSIIAIATIIGSLLMGGVSIFCIIKVEQNAENLFQSFMQNKVFVSRVEKIVQSYIEQRYPGLRTTTTTGTVTSETITSDAR